MENLTDQEKTDRYLAAVVKVLKREKDDFRDNADETIEGIAREVMSAVNNWKKL